MTHSVAANQPPASLSHPVNIMRRSRVHLIALLSCSSVNHSPSQSFSWQQISRIRSPRMCGGAQSRTASLWSAIHCLGRCDHDIPCATRFRIAGNDSICKNNLALRANRNSRDESMPKKKVKQPRARNSMSTFSTAVCIVPPDDAWDTIQRARHLARDTSFYKVTK